MSTLNPRAPGLGERKGQSTTTQGFPAASQMDSHGRSTGGTCSLLGKRYPSAGERGWALPRGADLTAQVCMDFEQPRKGGALGIGGWCGRQRSVDLLLGFWVRRMPHKNHIIPIPCRFLYPQLEFSEREPSHMLPGAQTGLEHHDTQNFWFVHQQ